jgi:hypothetical protein
MLQTLNNIYEGQIVGGIFSNRDKADQAIVAFQSLDISRQNIQVIQLDNNQAKDPCTNFLVGQGFTHSQALYYDKGVRAGRILVTVYEVTDLTPIIHIFDKFNAKYQLKHK